jgi:hypothetical protein
MPIARLFMNNRTALPDLLKGLSKGLRDVLRDGFQRLGSVDAGVRASTLRVATELAAGGGPTTAGALSDAASKIGLSKDEVASLLSAVSFTLSILPATEFTAEQFADDVIQILEISAEARPAILELGKYAVANRKAIVEAAGAVELASEHLPALAYFGTSVDMRLAFEKDQLSAAVPVLLVNIDTDEENESLSFQMTRRQLETVIEDLKKVASHLRTAEDLIPMMLGGKGR